MVPSISAKEPADKEEPLRVKAADGTLPVGLMMSIGTVMALIPCASVMSLLVILLYLTPCLAAGRSSLSEPSSVFTLKVTL